MRLVTLMLTRNGAWSLRATAPATLRYSDDLVVLCDACTDETVQIVADLAAAYPDRVHVLRPNRGDVWPEVAQRATTQEAARQLGATHLLVSDDDDLLSANLVDRVRPTIAATPPGGYVIVPRWRLVDHELADRVRWVTLAFGDAPTATYGPIPLNESPRFPAQLAGMAGTVVDGLSDGGLMHLSGLQPGGEAARIAYYRMQARLRCPELTAEQICKRYHLDTVDPTMPVPAAWWPPGAWDLVDWRRPPWQAAECRRLLATYGAARFADLDLLGVLS